MRFSSGEVCLKIRAVVILGVGAVFAASAVPFSYTNSGTILISDSTNSLTKGSPYPSPILVAGLDGQVITKATVTIHGLSHTFPSDVSVLLVGPRGQSAVLMSETGGQNKLSITNLTIAFDDDSTNSLPIYTALQSGTFKPTDGYLALGYPCLPYDFPPPAPSGNSNSPASLSVFKGSDPDGTWNLFLLCDAAGTDSGILSNGWSLNLSVLVPLQISRIQSNVVLSWPASATNFHLQSAPTLTISNAWTNVPTVPFLGSGSLSVTNPILRTNLYYRLIGN